MSRPELLSPAGSPEALRAAVSCGADAVYLGWGGFNARRGAKNFSDEEFRAAAAYCRERGVKVYLTLNTLISDRELPAALEAARTASRLGVDAVLIQDWGLLLLLRQVLPELPLHASTQMSLFTSGGCREAAADGCSRIVLARECSREDLAAILRNRPTEIEVFAHGALCMCYSGQCAMSALIGGRSGNRGRCAQPCRLPYGLNAPAGDCRPLSLRDLNLASAVPDLADLGVDCLKLEGRMKRPEYVAVVTGIYARLLREGRGPSPGEAAALEAAFSRSGFTDGYWRGRTGPSMLGFRPENAPEPSELFARARDACARERTAPVAFSCTVRSGAPCVLSASDGDGRTVTVSGPVPEPARSRALTAEEAASRLRKTGGTAYRCVSAEAAVDEGLFLSAGTLNALRREALAALSAARSAPAAREERPLPPPLASGCASDAPEWTVSVAETAQLTGGLLRLRPARVYVPLEKAAELPSLPEGDTAWCAVLPRAFRDRDEPELRRMLDRAKALGFTAAAVGNLGHLPLARDAGLALWGDFGLNVFNGWAMEYLRRKGLASACLSFELRWAQLRDLPKRLPAEAVVYGRLPLMITENCVIRNGAGCRCGRPNVLTDRSGVSFPVLPAYGHRNEIENSVPLWLADRPELRRLGLRYLRLRFTTETPEECVRVFRAFQDGAPPPGAFTRGLFDRGVE